MMTLAEKRYEIAQGDDAYPVWLLDLDKPPSRLYVRGDPSTLSRMGLAIVGSRDATPYGISAAQAVATAAAQMGVTVVSGGALGVDSAAGTAALDAGGRHILVLGCGADVVYPARSAKLIERTVASGGAVVSIERWGAPPRRYAFPKRNRIIAALSRAVCITEAGIPSGTFTTAEAALSLDREVLAVPGSIYSPQSRGTNYLISEGACCLADEEAIEVAISRLFDVMRFSRVAPSGERASDPSERKLMAALVASPLDAEGVGRLLKMGPAECLAYLSKLMVAGKVERLVDGRFSPTKSSLHARSPIMHNG